MKIWVIEGVGDGQEAEVTLKPTETVGVFRARYAKKIGVSSNNVELTDGHRKLTNDSAKMVDVMRDGEAVNVVPRAKAGK